MRFRARYRIREDRLDRIRLLLPSPGPFPPATGIVPGGRHAGIDILAPAGAEVRAASAGLAGYAGNGMRGYGNAVILDHGDGITTLYGHSGDDSCKIRRNRAGRGRDRHVGRSGNATTHHLHFELRVDGKAVDPARI